MCRRVNRLLCTLRAINFPFFTHSSFCSLFPSRWIKEFSEKLISICFRFSGLPFSVWQLETLLLVYRATLNMSNAEISSKHNCSWHTRNWFFLLYSENKMRRFFCYYFRKKEEKSWKKKIKLRIEKLKYQWKKEDS